MKRSFFIPVILSALVLLLVFVLVLPGRFLSRRSESSLHPSSQGAFIANKGQWDTSVWFIADFKDYTAFVTKKGWGLALEGKGNSCGNVVMEFADSRTGSIQPRGSRLLAGNYNFYIGSDPTKWKTGVPSFDSVLFSWEAALAAGLPFRCLCLLGSNTVSSLPSSYGSIHRHAPVPVL